MKSRWIAVLLAALMPLLAGQWKTALPGYHYEFPRDHFSHPDYRTEWWYYTGNLRAPDGHRFGFELTFFRFATATPEQAARDVDESVESRPNLSGAFGIERHRSAKSSITRNV